MNKKIVAASSFFLLLLVLPLFGSAFAQGTASAGVSVGDRFTYVNTITWNSTNPADFMPSYLMVQNESTLQVNVDQVSGSTIQVITTWTYRNGTQQTSAPTPIEVYSGITGSLLAYAANLTAGGSLFPGASDQSLKINDTTYRSYPDSFRDTNHIVVNSTGQEGEAYSYMNLYFDRQTGILIEYYLTSVYTATPNQMVTQHLALTDSSLWKVTAASTTTPGPSASPDQTSNPSNPSVSPTATGSGTTDSTSGLPIDLIVIVIVVVVAVVMAGLVLFRKPKPKPEPQPQAASAA